MRKFFKYLPYYLVVFFFYCPLYGLFILLLQNPKLTELYLLNIFILTPIVVFIVSLLYSYRFGFSLYWLLVSCLLYGFTIITFGEFILLYFLAYEIFALAGMAVGVAIKNLMQKLKSKKLSQNP
ncbi:hypothetical protein [Streptococcus oralis]|uniref:hypothetical protein n=1 Tax=Streptococcus oralis TaxID=1303 RepID=UPI00066E35FA|nr:hypothetical protein [Streptococcus oralis]